MRHTPYESEYRAAPQMSDSERLDYFLTRCFETDEVWFLAQQSRPLERELTGRLAVPVWPYARFADDAANTFAGAECTSISLEHFLYRLLDELQQRDVWIEVMPRDDAVGCLITPQRLSSIFEGMIDAGEYRFDG